MAGIPPKRLYENAIDVMYSAPYFSTYEIAIFQFQTMKEYKDSPAKLKECLCLSKMNQCIDPVKLHLYVCALELQLDGYPQLARNKYELVGPFRFAHRHMQECRKALENRDPPPKLLLQAVPENPILREVASSSDSRLERSSRTAFYRKTVGAVSKFNRHTGALDRGTITAFLVGAGVSAAVCSALYFFIL